MVLSRRRGAANSSSQRSSHWARVIQADPIWHDFFYTELTTGLRRGEICGLQWQDFNAGAGTLQISRTLLQPAVQPLGQGHTAVPAQLHIPEGLNILVKLTAPPRD